MEFEKLVSSLDAEGLARAAEALLRLLSGGTAERTAALSDSGLEREARTGNSFPLSAPGAAKPPLVLPRPAPGAAEPSPVIPRSAPGTAEPPLVDPRFAPGTAEPSPVVSLPTPGAAGRPLGTESEGQNDLTAAEELSLSAAVPGGEAAADLTRAETRRAALSAGGTAEREIRLESDAARRGRPPGPGAAEELARIEERLAAVSARNRRALGADTETLPPYLSAGGGAAAGSGAAGPELFSVFAAPRSGPGAAAAIEKAGTETAAAGAVAAERSFFHDAEAVSEFFRRDSRRYDSGFSD